MLRKLNHKKVSRMKLLKFWSFFLVTQAQKVIWGQKCAEVPNLKDFELANYAGVWYEQVRYPNTFQKEGSMLVYLYLIRWIFPNSNLQAGTANSKYY